MTVKIAYVELMYFLFRWSLLQNWTGMWFLLWSLYISSWKINWKFKKFWFKTFLVPATAVYDFARLPNWFFNCSAVVDKTCIHWCTFCLKLSLKWYCRVKKYKILRITKARKQIKLRGKWPCLRYTITLNSIIDGLEIIMKYNRQLWLEV